MKTITVTEHLGLLYENEDARWVGFKTANKGEVSVLRLSQYDDVVSERLYGNYPDLSRGEQTESEWIQACKEFFEIEGELTAEEAEEAIAEYIQEEEEAAYLDKICYIVFCAKGDEEEFDENFKAHLQFNFCAEALFTSHYIRGETDGHSKALEIYKKLL